MFSTKVLMKIWLSPSEHSKEIHSWLASGEHNKTLLRLKTCVLLTVFTCFYCRFQGLKTLKTSHRPQVLAATSFWYSAWRSIREACDWLEWTQIESLSGWRQVIFFILGVCSRRQVGDSWGFFRRNTCPKKEQRDLKTSKGRNIHVLMNPTSPTQAHQHG